MPRTANWQTARYRPKFRLHEHSESDASDIQESDYFRMFVFKIEACARKEPHDWTVCQFSHNTEKARRRCPTVFIHHQNSCTEFRKHGSCRAGDRCEFAHGVFEGWLSPARYHTEMCTSVNTCARPVCFFAHTMEQLRSPTQQSTEAMLALRKELLLEFFQNPVHTASLDHICDGAQLDKAAEVVGYKLVTLQWLLKALDCSVMPELMAKTLDELVALRKQVETESTLGTKGRTATSVTRNALDTSFPQPYSTDLPHMNQLDQNQASNPLHYMYNAHSDIPDVLGQWRHNLGEHPASSSSLQWRHNLGEHPASSSSMQWRHNLGEHPASSSSLQSRHDTGEQPASSSSLSAAFQLGQLSILDSGFGGLLGQKDQHNQAPYGPAQAQDNPMGNLFAQNLFSGISSEPSTTTPIAEPSIVHCGIPESPRFRLAEGPPWERLEYLYNTQIRQATLPSKLSHARADSQLPGQAMLQQRIQSIPDRLLGLRQSQIQRPGGPREPSWLFTDPSESGH